MTTLLLVSMYNVIACIWVASDFFLGTGPSVELDARLTGVIELCATTSSPPGCWISSNMQLYLLLLVLATAAVSKPVEETDQSLLWGPYRPNLYFGIRPRLPQSLMTGLIWFSTVNYQSVQSAFVILARKRGTRVY